MSLEAALRTHLADDVGDRIYPLVLPESAQLPARTYQRIDTVRTMRTHDEASSKSPARPRFQINNYAIDDPAGAYAGYDKALELAAVVRARFEGFAGLLGGTVPVTGGEVVNQLDDYDETTGRFRSIVDVMFTTTED